MNVSLTPELEDFVGKKVGAGRYRSASEVVREGLRLLEDQDKLKSLRRAELGKTLLVGVEQLEQGKTMSTAEFVRELQVHRRTKRSAKHA